VQLNLGSADSIVPSSGSRGRARGVGRLPDEPSLLVGVHSRCALTMDAWTLVAAWYRRFGEQRILHGTGHDVLMATPGLSHYTHLSP